MSLRQNVA